MTTTFNDKHQQVLDQYRTDMLSGVTLDRIAFSHQSIQGRGDSWVMVNYQAVARAMDLMAKLARRSEALTYVALSITKAINPYAARYEFQAAIARAAAYVVHEGFDDVVARTGPEPVRFSDAQRKFSLAECALINFFVDAAIGSIYFTREGKWTVGWALQAILEETNLAYLITQSL